MLDFQGVWGDVKRSKIFNVLVGSMAILPLVDIGTDYAFLILTFTKRNSKKNERIVTRLSGNLVCIECNWDCLDHCCSAVPQQSFGSLDAIVIFEVGRLRKSWGSCGSWEYFTWSTRKVSCSYNSKYCQIYWVTEF